MEDATGEGSVVQNDYNGAFELARVLLDLLRSSFARDPSLNTNGKVKLSNVTKAKKNKTDTSPISLSMHLVSATAAFYQICDFSEEKKKFSQEENDRVMSKIPHDITTWTPEMLGYIRILLLYTTVALCSAVWEKKLDVKEVTEGQNIRALMETARKLLKNGGLTSNEMDAPMETSSYGQDAVPSVEITAPAKNRSTTDSAVPDHVVFVCSTMKSLMNSLGSGVTLTSLNPNQLTDVTDLLREFDRCGGYELFEKIVHTAADQFQTHEGKNGTKDSPRTSVNMNGNSPNTASASSVTIQHRSELHASDVKMRKHSSSVHSSFESHLRKLFRVWEDMLRSVKRAKTEYIHQVTCMKRSHRHCDLAIALHQHHDIMGVSFSKSVAMSKLEKNQTSKTSSRWSFHGSSFWGSESPKSKSKKHKYHSNDDTAPPVCVIGRAVEFLVKSLLPLHRNCAKLVVTSLDRIGVCHCVTPSYLMVPLLSSLSSLPHSTQDTVLAVVGRLILQRMASQCKNHEGDDAKHADISSVQLPSMLPTAKVFKFRNDGSFTEDDIKEKVFNSGPDKERKTPIVTDEPNEFEKLLEESEDKRWLCLAMYRDLLLGESKDNLGPNVDNTGTCLLPTKVARHLVTIAPYFDLDGILNLLTTVLIPVLSHAAVDSGSLRIKGLKFRRKRKNTHQKNPSPKQDSLSSSSSHPQNLLHPAVISSCLEIIHHHVQLSPECRKIFIRHCGIRPVTQLLLGQNVALLDPSQLEDKLDQKKQITELASQVLCALLTHPTTLSSFGNIFMLNMKQDDEPPGQQSSPKMKRKMHEEPEDSQDAGGFRNLFRGFSPLSGLSPKQQRRLSPFKRASKSPDRSQKSGADHSSFEWDERAVNEVEVFNKDLKLFSSSVLQAISNLSLSPDEDVQVYHPGPNYPDSVQQDEMKDKSEQEVPSSCSDTTGYHSRSRESSLDSSNRLGQKVPESSDEEQSILDLDLDGVCLPMHDLQKMTELCDLCSLLSSILQENRELQLSFSKFDGPELVLRLLTLVTASLIPTNARNDFTNASSEVSPNRSLLQSVEEQTQMEVQEDPVMLKKIIPAITVERPSSSDSRSTLCSTPNENSQNVDLAASMDHTFNISSSKSPLPYEFPSPEDKDEEVLMALKFQLLSSTLSMALLSTEIDLEQHDVSSDDIISTLKPLLKQSEITSSKYCIPLCKCLFQAAVQVRRVEQTSANISATLSSLKQQVMSPRKSVASPGYQRYSMSFFHGDSPSPTRKAGRRRTDSVDSELSFSDADDNSSVYDMMLNIERTLDTEDGTTTDGYQGDSESDKPATQMNGMLPGERSSSPELLVSEGIIRHPKLIALVVELLGDAGDKFETSPEQPSQSRHQGGITQEEHNDNIRILLFTITTLIKFSQSNLEHLMTGCDLPLACLESFKSLLQKNNDTERDIRQMLLDLCLSMNTRQMTARHLRLILSFFNSQDPPLEQLLQYLLLLIQHQLPGPSQYLQFPVDKDSASSPVGHHQPHHFKDAEMDLHSLSVWKVAPLRMALGSSVTWPSSNVGVTISLWLSVVGSSLGSEAKSAPEINHSWDSTRVVVIDIDNSQRMKGTRGEFGAESSVTAPYYHLVSVGTKQTMLQVWLEQGTMIFRICVDPDDGKQVGVLAQTECEGLLVTNGEWQHLTLTYTENKLPDKTILGKVHVIANCTTERDVILEHNIPKTSGRMNQSNRKHAQQEPNDVNLFLGHMIKSSPDKLSESLPAYSLGNVMLFDRIHFSLISAFAIFSRGPSISNLIECLVSDVNPVTTQKSSASASSRIRFSRSSSQISSSPSSPLSPGPKEGVRHSSQFFLLPHSLLLSDLVPVEYLSGENVPDVKTLQEHLVLSYSPTEPGIFLFNHVISDTREPDRRRSFSLFSSSPPAGDASSSEKFDPMTQQCIRALVKKQVKIRPHWNRGLHRALNQVGGIQVFLLLCAKVVEVTSNSLKRGPSRDHQISAEWMQCLALQTLLQLRSVDSKRQQEFATGNIASMLHKLLTKQQCVVSFRTLQILFNYACSGDDVIQSFSAEDDQDAGDHYEVNFDNSAIIRDQELLQVFLTDWRVWHKSTDLTSVKDPDDKFPVWSMLLHGLLSLVREDHPYQWFNIRAILQAGLVHRMLTGLQQMVTDSIEPFPGTSVTAPMMELLRTVVGSPPNFGILSRICDFLIATHPPAGTFVCHASSSFYFNLRAVKISSEHESVSNPTSPTERLGADAGRPKLNRSISAPAKSETDRQAVTRVTLSDIREDVMTPDSMASNGLSDTSESTMVNGVDEDISAVTDKQARKIKALSIIEEGESSESGRSSRTSTPSRINSSLEGQQFIPSSPKYAQDSSFQEGIGANESDSWEDVPHSLNPAGPLCSPIRENPEASRSKEENIEEKSIKSDTPSPSSESAGNLSDTRNVAQPDYMNNQEGLSSVTCELLNLMFIAVMTMSDNEAFELTSGPLNAGTLVVCVHHKSAEVRTATVRLLAAYFSRCNERCQEEFLRQKGFHLVANQLHQHDTTRPLVDACLYFLLGLPASSEEALPLDGTAPDPAMLPTPAPDPFSNHAAVLLLAVLENSTHDFLLCRDLVTRLSELFECMGPIADVMLDNGLTLALCNLITCVMSPACTLDLEEKEGVLEEVEHFMTCIAVKACVTSGSAHFQVFEDLFTLLYVIENEQAKVGNVESEKNVARIQALSYHILAMVLELMQRSTAGKSPMVPRKQTGYHSRPPSGTFAPNFRSYSRRSSSTQLTFPTLPPSEAPELHDGPISPVSEHPPSSYLAQQRRSIPPDLEPRRFPLKTQTSKSMYSRRISHSAASSASSESSIVFRPHGGGLRTRSFKGSQRRRINEAETSRRLQRVIMIAVDKLIFSKSKINTVKRMDKETTFAAPSSVVNSDNETSHDDVFQGEEPCNFAQRLFETLFEWLSVCVMGSSRGGTPSRSARSSSSRFSSTSYEGSSQISSGWARILSLSRENLIDQAVRLFTHLMSPWQSDLRMRIFPLSVSQKPNMERLLIILFPKDSVHGRKVSTYLHYLLCYYKQQMTTSEKKELKQFCRLFHRCGHKIYPPPQSANGVANKGHSRSASTSGIEKSTSTRTSTQAETIEKNQAIFDNERQLELQNWRSRSNAAFKQLKLRTDHLSHIVSQHAMDMTQQVVLRQNIERKKMIAHMKDVISNDLSVRKQWAGLLEQLAHERAVWYDAKRYPKSWQLDPTEGPNRERRRLQRCHLGIDERFMMKKSEETKRRELERKENLRRQIREMVDENLIPDEEASSRSFRKISGPLDDPDNLLNKRPLSFLFEDDSHSSDSITIRTRLQTNERISMVQSCTNVTPSCETPGEILIGESSMYFVGDEVISDPSLTQALFGECEVLVLSWRHEDVAEVHKRWWQLQDIAIEIFLTNGKTYLIAFKTAKERDLIVHELNRTNLPNLLVRDMDINHLTQMWRSGAMTNFEYLTRLNKAAGRSFNDLMQYPVMPFILADYTSAILDLNKLDSFRNLHRPISVPDDTRMQHYKDRYKFLSDDYNNCTEDERELRTAPFHYGSHYSNSGTVLHFLVRLPPFTRMFLEYQDASFDIPDRTFHSMETTFRLSSYSSTTDVKELVPEFFFLPEFLCNLEGFDFGLRQCGLRVNHVILPPWSKADPRLYVLIHRQAMESDYVTANLHGWIDLVFGFKQKGKQAVDAVNVFHPATYFGMDVSSVEDPVKRKALETMVKTYGQTPKQLFSSPHPAKILKPDNFKDQPSLRRPNGSRRSSLVTSGRTTPVNVEQSSKVKGKSSQNPLDSEGKSESQKYTQRPLSSVLGLKWGTYLGSPSAPEPTIFLLKSLPEPAGSLIPLQTNDVCALAPRMGLLVIYNREQGDRFKSVDIRWSALLTYGHPDNIVRLKMRKALPNVNLLRTPADDRVTCCTAAPDCRAIVLGHRSGSISVNRCNPVPSKSHDLEFQRGTVLYGHVAEITCLVACGEFRILASGSRDGTVVLWDMDSLTYIRSLTGHATAVSAMAISRTSGDVCTVCDSGNDEGSHIRLWTINGSLLAAQDTKRRVGCVTFSSAPEGISVNVVAGGMSNGVIRLWSSWDLTPVRDIEAHGVQRPITCLTFTHNSGVLYAATDNGVVIGWCFKDKTDEKQPILISFLNVGEKS